MTRPRSALVSLSDTPWYHVVNRCVRRAFLCGHDAHSGCSFEHCRAWVETRIRELASVFAIDVAAYAVMSNHYHVVVRVDAPRAQGWDDDEVLRRWTQLFTGPLLVQHYLQPAQRALMGQAQLAQVQELAAAYRARLHDLSWYMRVLNESIARQANAEDGVRGRFWEGRFKSQALLDEQALLAVMAYVDLNPVRAGMAEDLEGSAHTSIAARLAKRGAISVQSPPILQRLGMDAEAFIACADTFFRTFAHAVGTPASLVQLAAARQCRALRGMALARRVLQHKQLDSDKGRAVA